MAGTLLQIFLGQLASFNLAIMSFTVSLITNQGVDAPLSVSFFAYLSLAVVYGAILLCRRQKLQLSWYWYAALAFVDVQGNFLVTKAYEYTSITSITLLDCFTIAWAIVLTWLFLGTRYSVWQFFGVGVSLAGLALLLLSDYDPLALDGSKPLFGDIFVIGGTVFLSMSNVGVEFCVKKKDRVEVMAMIGFFGVLITTLGMYPYNDLLLFQDPKCYFINFVFSFNSRVGDGEVVDPLTLYRATLERKSLESITFSPQLVFAYVGCTIVSFTFYALTPHVLKISGATLLNLSLLTSDVWVVVIRIFIYKQQIKWLYYPAYALVVLGISLYLKMGKDESVNVVDDDYCILEEESGILVHDKPSLLVKTNIM